MAGKTIKIKLKSTASAYYKTTKKNPQNTPEKLLVKKFDPVVRRHVEFKETKIK